jgi:hypothetical protein
VVATLATPDLPFAKVANFPELFWVCLLFFCQDRASRRETMALRFVHWTA